MPKIHLPHIISKRCLQLPIQKYINIPAIVYIVHGPPRDPYPLRACFGRKRTRNYSGISMLSCSKIVSSPSLRLGSKHHFNEVIIVIMSH